MPDGTEERYCPICEERMYDSLCPKDGVQTVPYSSVSAKSHQLVDGTIIAERYRVESICGSGAMGSVYLAVQIAMDRRVALKVLKREALRDGTELKRFFREARNASRLRHPNIVQVYDFGIDETTQMPFIAMELLEGRTLRKLIAQEAPLGLQRTARLLEQVSKALVTAHEFGIIHRDLKPDNIMVGVLPGDDEHVTVLDFGIAKSVRTLDGVQVDLTETGAAIGTPRYMSPEQVCSQDIDFRSDLYSLGCIFHEMLTGQAPFTADDAVSLMHRHVNAVRPPLPEIEADPASFEAARVLQACLLSQTRDRRPSSTDRVARVFRKIALGQPPEDPAAILAGDDIMSSIDGLSGSDEVELRREASGSTATHVKVRPEHTPTPVDSRYFDDLHLPSGAEQSLGQEREGARPPERGRFIAIAVLTLVSVMTGWFVYDLLRAEPPPEPPPAPPERIDLRVTGQPNGAKIFVDGEGRGALPSTVSLEQGDALVEVRVEAEGFEPRTFMVRPNGDRELEVQLAPVPPPPVVKDEVVEVHFVGEPVGATIWLEGRRMGTVPTTLELEARDTVVRFRVEESSFHKPRMYPVRLDKDRRVVVKLPLKLMPRPK